MRPRTDLPSTPQVKERIDGGKLRCTGATWTDAVVIFPGEVLGFQNIERQAHALRVPAPGTVVETPPAAARASTASYSGVASSAVLWKDSVNSRWASISRRRLTLWHAQEASACQPAARHCRGLFFSHLRSASALARLAVAGQRLVLPPQVATMTPPLSVTMRRDDLRKKFRRPPDLDEKRQSTGIGTGHVSAPSRQTH